MVVDGWQPQRATVDTANVKDALAHNERRGVERARKRLSGRKLPRSELSADLGFVENGADFADWLQSVDRLVGLFARRLHEPG